MEARVLCNEGLRIMRRARDKSHGVAHVFHIFDNLNYLLDKNPTLKSKINFDVLILAICWHDVWISTQKPRNVLHIIYMQFVEGVKSAAIFDTVATIKNFDPSTRILTKYVIRKHSSIQFLPAFVLEAKILFDLDKIEMWNYRRFFTLQKNIVSTKEFYQKYVVRLYMNYSEKMGLYFRELETVFRKNSKKFWRKVS